MKPIAGFLLTLSLGLALILVGTGFCELVLCPTSNPACQVVYNCFTGYSIPLYSAGVVLLASAVIRYYKGPHTQTSG